MELGSGRGLGLLAIAGCASLLLALPITATASQRSKTVPIPPAIGANPSATAKAKCPAGQRATGGGYRASASDTTIVNLFESRKVKQRAWRASASQSGGEPASLTAIVYCSKRTPKTTQKSKRVSVPGPSMSAAATAKCGRSGNALAGGFLTPEDPSPPYGTKGDIIDSYRAKRKAWRTRLRSASANPATLVSYVYCARKRAPKARSGDPATAPPFSKATAASKRCRRRSAIVAGGFKVLGEGTNGHFLPYASVRSRKRWRATGVRVGSKDTGLRSIAYCG